MQEIVHPKGKIYYSMGEVAELFGVNASLLRFWEEEFPILKIAKNSRGHRIYTTADVDNIRLIYYLVKEQGMTLDGAKKRIRQNRDGVNRDAEIVEHLRSIRNMLAALREELGGDTQVIEIDDDSAAEESAAPTPAPVAEVVAEVEVAPEEIVSEEEVSAEEVVSEVQEEAVPAEESFLVSEQAVPQPEKEPKAEKPAKAAKLGTLIGGNLFSPEDIRLAVAKQSAKESKKEAKNKVIEQTLF
ncbi:MAG: MerR family transcriptional regulator [Tidjanibacter sp.]|nr:MerR family transcriptional regulator [Tidjanibacter sp.]MBQ1964061.1 MerR family transcriptional regulator [Tidjanibacter sp.]MBQ5932075.1 MerR family transcriptional regulator [Tidjanibacter sp.]